VDANLEQLDVAVDVAERIMELVAEHVDELVLLVPVALGMVEEELLCLFAMPFDLLEDRDVDDGVHERLLARRALDVDGLVGPGGQYCQGGRR
jgi:hypothetical protein